MPAARTSTGRHRQLAFLLAAHAAVGPFCIDAYLPSMREISRVFGVSMLTAQQTLTAYMATFALMTLWHGAISDAVGRRRVMLVSLMLFTLASLGCALSSSIEMLLLFRALQGMTAGAGMVVGRAVVRDVCDGAEAQRMMALVSIVFAVAPAIAPVIGGWLHHWFGWRAVFLFMAAFAAGVFAATWVALSESLPRERRQPLRPGFLLRSYAGAMVNAPFMAASIGLACGFSGFFLYVVSAPVFVLQHLRLGETQFIWLYGPSTLGMVGGAWLSGRLAGKLSPSATVVAGLAGMGVAAAANVLVCLLLPPQLPWSVAPLFFYALGMSLTAPSLTILALDQIPRQRGLAASGQSFVQSAANSVNAAALAPLFWATPLLLASGMVLLFALAGVAVAVYLLTVRPASAATSPGEVAAGET